MLQCMPMFHRFMESTVDSENMDLSKLLQSNLAFSYTHGGVYMKIWKMGKKCQRKRHNIPC